MSKLKENKDKTFRKEALQATLLKKKECTTKALECVEHLIEKNITEDVLKLNLRFINQSTYQDIIDERSITNLCGYPLCSEQLKNVPKKQYMIARCNGKLALFDTTERKKFCSNICYKASKYLNGQLPSSPLWLIETKETDTFRLISLDSSGGGFGDEIEFASLGERAKPTTAGNIEDGSPKCSEDGRKESPTDDTRKETIYGNEKTAKREIGLEEFMELWSTRVDSTNSSDKDRNSQEISNESTCEVIHVQQKDDDDESSCKIIYNKNYNCSNSSVKRTDFTNVSTGSDNRLLKDDISEVEEELFFDACSDLNAIEKVASYSIDIKEEYKNNVDKNTLFKESGDESKDRLTKDRDIKTKIAEERLKKTNAAKSRSVDENRRAKSGKNLKCDKKKVPDISPMLAAVLKTEQCIREWVSIETLDFLLGKEKLKSMLEENGILTKVEEKVCLTPMRDPYIYERYLEICNKLNILDLKESKLDRNIINEEAAISSSVPRKPLPDFSKLKEEAKEMELKVRAFYGGDKRVQFAESKDTAAKEDESETKPPVILPLVDQHAQKALRRRIVLDHLNRVLPDMLRALGVTKLVQTRDVKDLISTFSLAANNIVFKPVEWNFLTIIIVKLLSVRDEILQRVLVEEKASKYLTLMLMSYEQDTEYLNRLMTWLLYEHAIFKM